MYKGIVTWEETFEGETSKNMRATTNTDAQQLVRDLMDYALDAKLIELEIKYVGKD